MRAPRRKDAKLRLTEAKSYRLFLGALASLREIYPVDNVYEEANFHDKIIARLETGCF